MDSLLELFCAVDDFCKAFLPHWECHRLANGLVPCPSVTS